MGLELGLWGHSCPEDSGVASEAGLPSSVDSTVDSGHPWSVGLNTGRCGVSDSSGHVDCRGRGCHWWGGGIGDYWDDVGRWRDIVGN